MPQSSLFSFFSSKAKAPAAAANPPKPPASSNASASTSSSTKAPIKQLSSSSAPAPAPTAPLPSVGERVEIYFPDDAEYFACDVVESVSSSESKFRVEYDDGNKEVVDFSEAEWKVCKNSRKRSAKKSQKSQKPQSSSNDSEAEFDSDAMEEDSEDEFKGDESSSEDDDIDDWMVDDDASEADADVFDEDSDSAADSSPAPKKRRLGKAKDASQSKKAKKTTPINKNSKVSFSPDYDPSAAPKTPGSNPLSQYKLTMVEKPSTPSVSSAPLAVTPASNHARIPSPAPTGPKELVKWVDGEVNPMGSHVHNHLPFLWKENLRDANGVKFGEPGYNSRTLKWSEKEIEKVTGSKMTAAKVQWWQIKAQYFDTVLLFKTGKFYEMFHMDSDIGVKVLGFSHMKGGEAHAGSPEAAYGTVCAKLVSAGYKVARVEQTETPAQLKIRKEKTPKGRKKPSVVNREVCAVTTVGTRTFCFLDSDRCFDKDSKFGGEADKGPLLVIKEIMLDKEIAESNGAADDDTPPAVCEYGVTMVDAVRGAITLGQFADDKLRSRLHTLLASTCPSEVIVDPTCSADLRTMISQSCGGAPIETVSTSETLPKSTATDPEIRAQLDRSDGFNPWDHNDCVAQIKRKKYFLSSSKSTDKEDTMGRWPKVVKACVDGGANLALGSMGAAIFYLQRSLVDYEIISMAEVRAYVPPMTTNAKVENTQNNEGNSTLSQMSEELFTELDGVKEKDETNVTTDHMQLDGITLENLEILANQTDGKAKGSLWSKINRTKTPHGGRLLRGWLLRPLFKLEDIARRADAVSELASGPPALIMAEAAPLMRKVGDVERLLSRIHSMGCSESAHPANRQVLYEGKTHTKRKVKDFKNLLGGLQKLDKIINLFGEADIKSTLLKKLVKREAGGGIFPNTTEKLKWFDANFNSREAEEGRFTPIPGMDEEYDRACEAKDGCMQELYALEKQYCSEIQGAKGKFKYINTKDDSKDKFMIELPVSIRVPSDFKVKGKRGSGNKQVNKYYTADIEEVVERLNEAIDQEVEGRARGLAAIFKKFDDYRPLWGTAVQVSGMLDALSALAEVSSQPGWSRPTILESKGPGTSSVDIKGGRHPCVEITHSGDDFVPNDLNLGGEEKERVLLLSGPNMGGKSTLLRQTCLISILAQIGCFVPAQSAAITPMDRIFTRLGASDKILAGQSTFFVELSETAAALRGATHRSIVIMDELGRGTSTFDGTALAHAVVKSLVEDTKCLTMFATHYHSLLEDWKNEPNVRLGHMKCLVTDGDEKNITFLYQLGEGACPKSFGINVARLAGLPEGVLAIAEKRSANFQREMEGGAEGVEAIVEKIRKAAEEGNVQELRDIWTGLNN